jgi:hypothetical protein
VKFYLPEDAEYLTDEAAIQTAEAGPDWHCDHCGADNKAGSTKCRQCGNDRTQEDEARETREYGLDEVPHSDEDTRPKKDKTPPPPPPSKSRKGLWGCLGVIGLIVAVLAFFFWPKSVVATVAGHRFERTIDVETYGPVQRSGWDLPAGATLIRQYQDVHHHDKVVDRYETRTRTVQEKVGEERYVCGKKDMGNGHFKDKYCTRPKYRNKTETYREPVYRDVPVYKTKYEYTIMDWSVAQTLKAEGPAKPARWPDTPAATDTRRQGKKTEKYWLKLKDEKGKEHELEAPYAIWDRFGVGDKMPAKANRAGGLSLDEKALGVKP